MKPLSVMNVLNAFSIFLTIAHAQPYVLRQTTISSGGGTGTSAAYSTTSSAGIPTIGKGSSSAYNQFEGFWSQSTIDQQTITEPVVVGNRWNMVSVPVQVSDYSTTSVFPTASSVAYTYNGSYTTAASLANGKGYWLKFSGAQIVPIAGTNLPVDSIYVTHGWNLIGSISSSISVLNITSNPGGIVTSDFYGFTSGYNITDSIKPGRGYWVKVNQSGKLILSASGSIAPSNRIRIVSDKELPPSPPIEDNLSSHPGIPVTYNLEQNFPNPFNPVTTIRFELPVSSEVSLIIYDLLGREVKTLVNNQRYDPGRYEERFDASELASGIYFCRLKADALKGSHNYVEVRKMALLK